MRCDSPQEIGMVTQQPSTRRASRLPRSKNLWGRQETHRNEYLLPLLVLLSDFSSMARNRFQRYLTFTGKAGYRISHFALKRNCCLPTLIGEPSGPTFASTSRFSLSRASFSDYGQEYFYRLSDTVVFLIFYLSPAI